VAADAPHNLQVGMARLLAYLWPAQPADRLDRFADDGIVCLAAIGTENAASERLRELLGAAYGSDWSPAKQESLLAAAGFGGSWNSSRGGKTRADYGEAVLKNLAYDLTARIGR